MGKGVVGKSTLTYRFIKYDIPEGHEATIEDRYKTEITLDNKTYIIEILDTAGEDDYQQMMDMWISFGEGFLLVFAVDDRESFELISKKRERILKGKHGQPTPMVLVANKIDLADKRKVTTEEAKKLAESWEIDYIETSAKNNLNCKEAFEKLTKKIATIKDYQKRRRCCFVY